MIEEYQYVFLKYRIPHNEREFTKSHFDIFLYGTPWLAREPLKKDLKYPNRKDVHHFHQTKLPNSSTIGDLKNVLFEDLNIGFDQQILFNAPNWEFEKQAITSLTDETKIENV